MYDFILVYHFECILGYSIAFLSNIMLFIEFIEGCRAEMISWNKKV